MNKQIDDKNIKDGTWITWTKEQEPGFVISFVLSLVGFFVVFFVAICLIS